MNRGKEAVWSASLVAFITLLSHGVFASRLGIYYDAWVSYYLLSRFGLPELIELAWGQARPVAAIIMWLHGNSPLVSHLMMFVIYISIGLVLLYLLRRLLPNYPGVATLITVLFLVYPAYWIRPTNTATTVDASLLFFLLSLAAMYQAVRVHGWRRWAWIGVSLVLAPAYFFTYELPFGLETVRPLLIWAALAQRAPEHNWRTRLRQTTLWSLLWVIPAALLLIYRLYIFTPSGYYASIEYNTLAATDNGDGFAGLMNRAFIASGDVLLNSWLLHLRTLTSQQGAYAWLVGMVAGALTFGYAWRFKLQLPPARVLFVMLGFGLAAMVSGLLPIVIARESIPITGLDSRWAYVATVAAAVVVVAFIALVTTLWLKQPGRELAALVIALLIGAGAMLHTRNSEAFVHDWEQQRAFWWGLAARIPDFEDDTTLIIDHSYARGQGRILTLYETAIAGDLFYNNPRLTAVEMQFAASGETPSFFAGDWRVDWSINLQRAVVVSMDESSCIRIIDLREPLPEGVTVANVPNGLELLTPDPATRIRDNSDREFPERAMFLPIPDTSGADCIP
ncbi:MAG: hypothetical protein SF123_10720 [Chloroflexota bacterium]|nr:hypothetical protein [Chloroflexota bacterium]